MTHNELILAAYLIVGIGYHYGQTFSNTYRWNVPIRWFIVVAVWPGVIVAHFINAIAGRK